MATATFADDHVRSSRALLFGSLVVNLFLMGLVVALLWQPIFSPTPTRDRSLATRIEQLAGTLSSSDARALRSAFDAKAGAIDEARQDYRGSLERARETLKAEPFVEAPALAALEVARQKRASLDAVVSGVLVTAAAGMSPEGRDKLAEWRSGGRR